MTNNRRVADVAIQLALDAGLELFKDRLEQTYARFPKDDHTEVWRINSHAFKNWFRDLYFQAEGHGFGREQEIEIKSTLEAKAYHDGKKEEVYVRLAYQDGNIYLDLANDAWQVVEVTAKGWQVIDKSPVNFRHTKGQEAMPVPTHERGGLRELDQFFNFTDDQDRVLTVAFIVGAYHPTGPYPVYVQVGEQGTAKSTRSRFIAKLIDPRTPALRSGNVNEQDIMLWSSSSWLISYDNLSSVSPNLSDTMCRVSTGGGAGKRKLYDDDEEVLFDVKRPQTLNGISELATRGDLLDRAILVYPQKPELRIPEQELYAQFDKAWPRILGAILDGVQSALVWQQFNEMEDLPRMADFAVWVDASEFGLEWKPGTFLDHYRSNQQEAQSLAIEGHVVASELVKFVRPGCKEQTASDWLQWITDTADMPSLNGNNPVKLREWPRTSNRFSSDLNRIAPAPRSAGITIEKVRTHKQKYIKICREKDASDAYDDPNLIDAD
jgi:hypothetical protein